MKQFEKWSINKIGTKLKESLKCPLVLAKVLVYQDLKKGSYILLEDTKPFGIEVESYCIVGNQIMVAKMNNSLPKFILIDCKDATVLEINQERHFEIIEVFETFESFLIKAKKGNTMHFATLKKQV